jgi:hypothetical protein
MPETPILAIQRLVEMIGGRLYKKYRISEKTITKK